MRITTINQTGLDFIASNEGFIGHVYNDDAGVPTIGYGFTYYPATGKKVQHGDPNITELQAQSMLKLLIKPYEYAVSSVTRDDLTQNEFNALVDFDYNVGHLKGSTLLKKVNAKQDVSTAFLMWDKIHKDGQLVADEGLKERRLKEIKLYNTK